MSKNVQLNNALDLRSQSVRRQIGVTQKQITGDSYDYTQVIGGWAKENGYDGIIAPSARNSSNKGQSFDICIDGLGDVL